LRQAREGIIDITPGIRSLQLHYQPETLALENLLAWVSGEWATVCMSDDLQVPTRVCISRSPGTIRLPQGDRQIYDHRPPGRPAQATSSLFAG
jgi:hypothetical protein